MRKIFWLMQLLLLLSFSVVLYQRNQIWGTSDLLPTEMLHIYVRDSSDFFLWLRTLSTLLLGVGIVMAWRLNKAIYLFVPVLVYALILSADSLVMHYMVAAIRENYSDLMPALSAKYYRGVIEAVASVFILIPALAFYYLSRHSSEIRFDEGTEDVNHVTAF